MIFIYEVASHDFILWQVYQVLRSLFQLLINQQAVKTCMFSVLFADVIPWSQAPPPPQHSSCAVHMFNETGRNVYACPICGSHYKFRTSLHCHMQTHKIQPMCPICHTVLNRKYDLRRHLRNVHKIDDWWLQQILLKFDLSGLICLCIWLYS